MENMSSHRRWLNDLKDKVWQIELMVSLGSWLTLSSLHDKIDLYEIKLRDTFNFAIPFYTTIYDICSLMLSALSQVSITLSFVFITCIFTRALWLSYIGIDTLFPQGINKKALGFKPIFDTQLTKQFSSFRSIIILNRISISLYSFAFLIAFYFIGISISLLPLLFLYFLYIEINIHLPLITLLFGIIFLLYFVVLFIYTLDIFTLFQFRKRSNSKIFYWIYRIGSLLTLSKIYEWVLLIYVSNSNKKQFVWVYSIIVIIAFAVLYKFESRNILNRYSYTNELKDNLFIVNSQYDDNRNNTIESVGIASIPSQMINTDVLPVFITYKRSYDVFFEKIKEIDYKNEKETDKNELVIASRFFQVLIDDSIPIPIHQFYLTKHPGTQELGFKCFLNIKNIPFGDHSLALYANKKYIDTTDVNNSNLKRFLDIDNNNLLCKISFFRASKN